MAPETTKEKAAWTVMVYLAGDNNLTDASVFAMTEMKRVAPGRRMNLITQFDPSDEYLPTHRYAIWRKDQPGAHQPLTEDIFDTSKNGTFKKESAFALSHERIRVAAKEKGHQEAIAEARRRAPNELAVVLHELQKNGGTALATRQLTEALEPVLLEPETRPSRENETDTGSPVTLYNFMSMCVQDFPADHYMVVLCGHGSGTAADFLLRDESPAGSLTISELKAAFEQLSKELNGQRIDILGLDTCLMSMAEVAYELRDFVKTMVSAESYSPVSGWPYQQIMESFKQIVEGSLDRPELEEGIERHIAARIVEDYINFYADYSLGGLSVDLAALNLDESEALRGVVNSFADALNEELLKENAAFKDNLILAHWEAQSYNGELFVDLVDFCDCLTRRLTSGPVFESGRKLKQYLLEHFINKSCYSGPAYQYSHGVSIYFPWARIDQEYYNLDFNSESGNPAWIRFLKNYTNLTRRAPRVPGDTTANKEFFAKNRDVDAQRFRRTQERGPERGNPITSMRNPPLYAEPEQCIRKREELRKGLVSLLAD